MTRFFTSNSANKENDEILDLTKLLKMKTITRSQKRQLQSHLNAKSNVLIVGGPAYGKTTMLNALVNTVPRKEDSNILVFAALPEMRLRGDIFKKSSMEADPVLSALSDISNRPQELENYRIVFDDLRQQEDVEAFVSCILADAKGFMASIHAPSAEIGLQRLGNLYASNSTNTGANFNLAFSEVMPLLRSKLDLIVHIGYPMDSKGHLVGKTPRRKVLAITEL